jgi:uncharacterized protein
MWAMADCPICKKPVRPRPENSAAPFCSPRCRQVDLGKWLNEEYRVATGEPPDEQDLEAALTQTPPEHEN